MLPVSLGAFIVGRFSTPSVSTNNSGGPGLPALSRLLGDGISRGELQNVIVKKRQKKKKRRKHYTMVKNMMM